MQIAPSTYYEDLAKRRDPSLRCQRAQRDEVLSVAIRRVFDENLQVYGARKVWKQMLREQISTARCTVERLMRRLGLAGAVRGKGVRTTISNRAQPCPLDKVNRQFHADRPNQLWVADFTYVSTLQGFVYVAFVIYVYARRIVGWKVSRSPNTDLVMAALEQALWSRKPDRNSLIHHNDRGVQYLSIRYSERLSEAGIEPSAGSVGDSYDNAMAESIIGLFKTEVIAKQSWRNLETVEWATLNWTHWYNHKRLMGPIGDIPPAEFEANYYQQPSQVVEAA